MNPCYRDRLGDVVPCKSKIRRNPRADIFPVRRCRERVRFGRVDGQDFFDGQFVFPVVAKVILIFEPVCRPETKIRKLDFGRIVGEGNAAFVGGPVPRYV